MSIILELDANRSVTKYPFKFNSIWLEDEELKVLAKNKWLSMSNYAMDSHMLTMVSKLKSLKSFVINWEKQMIKHDLACIESDLESIISQNAYGILPMSDKIGICNLESKQLNNLKKEETMWFQKSLLYGLLKVI